MLHDSAAPRVARFVLVTEAVLWAATLALLVHVIADEPFLCLRAADVARLVVLPIAIASYRLAYAALLTLLGNLARGARLRLALTTALGTAAALALPGLYLGDLFTSTACLLCVCRQ
ncbi:hypothetical protein L6R52_29660 [Myxococcota bacterium]|nr:hypothetical protein [Myxococcota bacterium]